ncbi:hypothetical protein F4780DRAFT_735937 [Xylariomycetidae sp. FL0641]|nr:hypothetical protein F4780DRAFT_735937 [Xylariomycetidae sp. FL0641]
MFSTLLLFLSAVSASAFKEPRHLLFREAPNQADVTPHDSYSSSIGVLGCKVNVNRIAYFPFQPDCNRLCIKITHTASQRHLHVLHVDGSGGAHDISYDAWSMLTNGQGAKEHPTAGGGEPMTWKYADISMCADIIDSSEGGRLPLGSTSTNYLADCPANSWVREHFQVYNIGSSGCVYGYNEICNYTGPITWTSQPVCPHTTGYQNRLEGLPVVNILYPTGEESIATI